MFWFTAATALALATACTTHRTAAREAPADPEWWLEALDVVHDQYAAAIVKSCPPQGFLSNERCVKAKIVDSFAMQNSAATHCRPNEPSGYVLLCADLLTATERTYRVLGLDPQSAMDWDDPFESLARVSETVAARLTSKCLDPAQGDCIAREMTTMLAVDPNDASRCVLTSDAKRQANCAMGLIRIEGYKSALPYVR